MSVVSAADTRITQDWVHSREVLDVDTSHDATSSTNQNLSFAGGPSGGLSSSALNAGPHTAGANNNSINNNNTTTTAATATTTATSRVPWIPVPDDPHVNTVCPICQEKFEQKWLDEAQEWVWMDAVRVGDRVYHASCHAEATRAGALRGGTPSGPGPGAGGLGSGARPTPERVLGKRKAEVWSPFVCRVSLLVRGGNAPACGPL
jgi:pre-mRNA cleavage complex 2 protein Pcf11